MKIRGIAMANEVIALISLGCAKNLVNKWDTSAINENILNLDYLQNFVDELNYNFYHFLKKY